MSYILPCEEKSVKENLTTDLETQQDDTSRMFDLNYEEVHSLMNSYTSKIIPIKVQDSFEVSPEINLLYKFFPKTIKLYTVSSDDELNRSLIATMRKDNERFIILIKESEWDTSLAQVIKHRESKIEECFELILEDKYLTLRPLNGSQIALKYNLIEDAFKGELYINIQNANTTNEPSKIPPMNHQTAKSNLVPLSKEEAHRLMAMNTAQIIAVKLTTTITEELLSELKSTNSFLRSFFPEDFDVRSIVRNLETIVPGCISAMSANRRAVVFCRENDWNNPREFIEQYPDIKVFELIYVDGLLTLSPMYDSTPAISYGIYTNTFYVSNNNQESYINEGSRNAQYTPPSINHDYTPSVPLKPGSVVLVDNNPMIFISYGLNQDLSPNRYGNQQFRNNINPNLYMNNVGDMYGRYHFVNISSHNGQATFIFSDGRGGSTCVPFSELNIRVRPILI